MSKIYSSSRGTIVWLKSEGEMAERALSALVSDWSQHLDDNQGIDINSGALLGGKASSGKSGSIATATLELSVSMLVYLKRP
jgi:hypothetical protein